MIKEPESIEDFTLLLLFHMAHVDGSIHPNERDTIFERMTELFPGYFSVEENLMDIELQYPRLGDERVESMLKSSITKFSDVDPLKRKDIYAALFDIINANGRVNQEETTALQVFKSWLLNQ